MITLFLSDRTGGGDNLFVGQNTLAVDIECSDIPVTGVTREVTNLLAAT